MYKGSQRNRIGKSARREVTRGWGGQRKIHGQLVTQDPSRPQIASGSISSLISINHSVPWSLKRKKDELRPTCGTQQGPWVGDLLYHASLGPGTCRERVVSGPEESCSEESWSRTARNKKSRRERFVTHWHSVRLAMKFWERETCPGYLLDKI